MAAQPNLILGTAGHIDHGKSSLILALTGTDPDRLKEEKTRGITIELGFAQLELPGDIRMGVVDVPGHERFVRQMIAGSTGIDIALFCIAADDGIMPQTEEHLAVLELLGIRTCIVALTKTDLVDEEWVMFMTDEIEQRLSTTSLAGSPIVPVSSKTGEGLDELKQVLAKTAKKTTRVRTGSAFRMPVDRVFTIKGSGTVITGTLWNGTATVGDEIEILPSGQRTRIRSVQMHGQAHDSAPAGNRVALNLNAVSTEEVRPGDFLSALGVTRASDRFDAEFTYLGLPGEAKPLISGARAHIAHGTKEVIGRILIMGGTSGNTQVQPGEKVLVQIRLDEPLPIMWGDRFVVRSYSPVHVMGGGMVLRAHPKRTTVISATTQKLLDALQTHDEPTIARTTLELEEYPVTLDELTLASGLERGILEPLMETLQKSPDILALGEGKNARYIMKRTMQKYLRQIENTLMQFHAAEPTATGISKENLRQKCLPKSQPTEWDTILGEAIRTGIAASSGGEVAHPKAGAGAVKAREQAADTLEALLLADGKTPQTNEYLIKASKLSTSDAYKALNLLEEQNRAVKVGSDFYFATPAINELKAAVQAALADGNSLSAADLKDAMGVSRKYAIPLLEYFDGIGFTRRNGDLRFLA